MDRVVLRAMGKDGLTAPVEEPHARMAALEAELARLRRPKGPGTVPVLMFTVVFSR